MANKELKVLAECVDSRNGKRFCPGEEFSPTPTAAQARRLISAGCLPGGALDLAIKADDEAEAAAEAASIEAEARAAEEEKARQDLSDAAASEDPAAQQRDAINDDKLFESTVDQLKDIAKAEEIDLGEAKRKDEIVAAIRAARATKPAA